MAEVTELISVRRPTVDKDLAFQPESLARTLSTMESKARLSLSSVMMGTPRYLPNSFVRFMPSLFSMATIFLALVWGEKKSFDLLWFTFWPEQLQKVSRTLLMVMLFFLVALAKRIKSSAKKGCVNEGPSLKVFTPVQFPRAISESMRSARYFMHRMKMYGEKESPWRMPLEGRKGSSFSPFIRTERLGELMHDMIIRSIHAFGKLN